MSLKQNVTSQLTYDLYVDALQRRLEKRALIVPSYLLVGCILFSCFVYLAKDSLKDYYHVATYSGDSSIKQMASDAGMNMKGRALFYTQNPKLVSASEVRNECTEEKAIEDDSHYSVCASPTLAFIDKESSVDHPDDAIFALLIRAYSRMTQAQHEQIENEIVDFYESGSPAAKKTANSTAFKKSDAQYSLQYHYAVIGSQVHSDDLSANLASSYGAYFQMENKT